MSFIVVYRGTGAGSSCEELASLDDAVRYVEQLRNDGGVGDAQIFRAEPVPYDFRPYFRVEIAPAAPSLPKPTRYSREMLLAPDDASALDAAEAAVPSMSAAPVTADEHTRGLFGR